MRARPHGVTSQSLNAAPAPRAALSSRRVATLSCASSRGHSPLRPETPSAQWRPLPLATDGQNRFPGHRCRALDSAVSTPRSMSTTLLKALALDLSRVSRRSRPASRTCRAAARDDCRKTDVQRCAKRPCFATSRSRPADMSPPSASVAISLRGNRRSSGGRCRPLSTCEQSVHFDTSTNNRTRFQQRVPDEERNACQCSAARRKPNRHY